MTIRCNIIRNWASKTKKSSKGLGILIPAYNEGAHIRQVLARCRKIDPAIIVVVDDASTDNSFEVLSAIAAKPDSRLRYLRNPHNLGKQGSVRRGLRALREMDIEAVALIDGDGQHDPLELPALVSLLAGSDFVIGLRSQDQMPYERRLSNWLVNLGFKIIGGVDFADVQSGLRVYQKPLADVLAERLPSEGGFALEHESLALLAAWAQEQGRQLRAVAAPISCRYGSEESAITPLHVLQLAIETVHQALRFRRLAAATV